MKNSVFYCVILLISFTRCTLSGKQEDHLNVRLNSYLKAINSNNTLQWVAATPAVVVRFYHYQGEKHFIQHFHQSDSLNHNFQLENPLVVDTKRNGKSIQRKYVVEKITKMGEMNSDYRIFALSEDGGNNWFFVMENDYFNQRIPIKNRLFKN